MLGLLLVAALRWLRWYAMTFCSPVLPARGEILKEGISPLALNQISFVECPRFMFCAAGRGEAASGNAPASFSRLLNRRGAHLRVPIGSAARPPREGDSGKRKK